MLGAAFGPTPGSALVRRVGASAGAVSGSRVNLSVWVAVMFPAFPTDK
jgi:hypothetical protein